MALTAADQIAVDLIGDHSYIVLFTNRAQGLQFLHRPNTAHRIVWRAEESQVDLAVADDFLKGVQIQRPVAAGGCRSSSTEQWRGNQLASHGLYCTVEGIIIGHKGKDFFAGLSQKIHQHASCRDHAGRTKMNVFVG